MRCHMNVLWNEIATSKKENNNKKYGYFSMKYFFEVSKISGTAQEIMSDLTNEEIDYPIQITPTLITAEMSISHANC